jgi:hypothetical protein
MGWGVTRRKVYDLLMLLTSQALEGEDSGDAKLVSVVFCIGVAINLTITSAKAEKYHSMDSRDDQAPRRRCSRQSYTWSSVRKRVPGSHGIHGQFSTTEYQSLTLQPRLRSSVSTASASTQNTTNNSEPRLWSSRALPSAP